MIIVVTGGRDFTAKQMIWAALDQLHAQHHISGLTEGEARGVDTLCRLWAESRNVPCYPRPADWAKHGKKAGILRNADMLLNDPPPTYCVAFPGGTGTADMIRRAERAGLVVWKPYG